MKLPKTVPIFGAHIKIIETKGLTDEYGRPLDGMYCYKTKAIYIDKGLSSEEKKQTLIHEMGHAMFHRVSISYTNFNPDLEEIIVNSFGTMIEETFDLRFKRKKG